MEERYQQVNATAIAANALGSNGKSPNRARILLLMILFLNADSNFISRSHTG